jgi:hypothetical protein
MELRTVTQTRSSVSRRIRSRRSAAAGRSQQHDRDADNRYSPHLYAGKLTPGVKQL